MSMLPSLMILDGESKTTLGIVRSLGMLGIPIMVGGIGALAQSGFSRFSTRRFSYPHPAAGAPAMHRE